MMKRYNMVFIIMFLVLLGIGFTPRHCLADKVITIAEGPSPQNLDPHIDTTQALMNITMAICEPLIWYDFGKQELVPNLATSWRALDERTWEVNLRKGVKFTNGEPFDANAVRYSILRVKDPKLKARVSFVVAGVQDVKIIDPYKVHIITKTPLKPLAMYLTRAGMVAPKYDAEKGYVEFGKKPIGTGPFMLNKWVQDEYVELKANPDYWNGKAKIDRVIFKSIPETITRMAALRTGEADIVSNVMIEEIPSIQKEKDLDIISIPSIRTLFVQYNMLEDSPLKDKRVRQAMNYAVDVDGIIKNVLEGYGIRLNGQVLCKEYWGYNPNLKPYPYDPQKAKALMKEAGAEDYVFTLNATTGRYLRDKEIAEVVGSQLNGAGIKTKVNIIEFGALMQQVWSGKFTGMVLWGVATPPPTADLFYGAIIRAVPPSTYVNEEFNQTYDKAAAAIEDERRTQLFNKVGEICRDDPPALFLHQQVTIYGVNKRVGGFTPSPDEWINPFTLYIK
jgi:peptide/nickel transport system substrate-binding protein